jgi:ribose 5-phosphate isomerase B
MQANRYKGIRAAICHNSTEAIETRGHNDANILCLSAVENSHNYAEIINAFVGTKPIPEEKYQRRCRKLDED